MSGVSADKLKLLKEFFPLSDIEFRVGTLNKEKTKGIVLAYIDNRAVQNRLDEVCGEGNWKNEYKEWKGMHQLCGLSINVDGEWITKWDGADDTAFESVKGGLSDSMKRAASMWGIGRYLYEIPNVWAEVIPSGNSYKFKVTPSIPARFLPTSDKSKPRVETADKSEKEFLKIYPVGEKVGEKELKKIAELVKQFNLREPELKAWAKVEKYEDMTIEKFNEFLTMLSKKYRNKVKFEFCEPARCDE